jgi:hypothetical protein
MSALMIARSLAVIASLRAELAAIRLLRRMAIGLVLLLLGLAGVGYLSAAAFLSLAAVHGAPVAALLVGLGCLIIALLGGVAARWLNNAGALR